MAVPFAIFWILIFVGRKELGWKGLALFVAHWIVLLTGFKVSGVDLHFFIAAEALLDVALVSTIYYSFTRLG